jgi:transposase
VFYRWQKEFFENGAAAFEHNSNGSTHKALEKQNAQLKAKIAYKDEVIAEIMADHVRLKKELGLG